MDASGDLDKPLDDIIAEGSAAAARAPVRRVGRGGGSGVRRGRGGGRRGGSRPSPYSRNKNREALSADTAGERFIKVAATSQPKTVAGSISHISRSGDAPSILCCGPDAINQAVKALAIARTYVAEDNIDFRASVEFESRDSAEATINLLKIPRREPGEFEVEELTAKKDSDPYKVAGAAAGRIRESKRVAINALGPDAVFRAVESVAITRRYLTDDGLELHFTPEFFHFETSQGSRSALRFSLLSSQI